MNYGGRFMRILLFFDLPMVSGKEKKVYRQFVKFLTNEGYIRIQYSLFCKLCINSDSAQTEVKRVKDNIPENGDVRLLIITEGQFQKIIDVNQSHSLQESITTTNRTLTIGEMNNENKDR